MIARKLAVHPAHGIIRQLKIIAAIGADMHNALPEIQTFSCVFAIYDLKLQHSNAPNNTHMLYVGNITTSCDYSHPKITPPFMFVAMR